MEDIKNLKKLVGKSNIVYFNGKTVKDKNYSLGYPAFKLENNTDEKVRIDFWDENNKILSLKSNY
ncbi:MAG: hypothetical protein PF487_04455 [Bacteroidales bacterium]|jgi:hypothetical protein|nr:hypothetical protein [Bacteroidales bacterium]